MTEQELYNYLTTHLSINVDSPYVGRVDVTLNIKNPEGEWEELDTDCIYIKEEQEH